MHNNAGGNLFAAGLQFAQRLEASQLRSLTVEDRLCVPHTQALLHLQEGKGLTAVTDYSLGMPEARLAARPAVSEDND